MGKTFYKKSSEAISTSLPGYKLYKDCHDLPLYNFLKIISENDLTYLVISGSPPEKTLVDLWEVIFNEYSDLFKDKQKEYVIEVIKEITVYNLNLDLIERIVNVMVDNPSEHLAGILRSMGFIFDFNPEDQDKYIKELNLTISKAKSLLFKLENAKKELQSLQVDTDKKTNYDSVLVTLGKYQGYRIDPKTTPVSEYVEVFNNYNREIEAQSAKASIPG